MIGAIAGTLTDRTTRTDSHAYDMAVDGDTLIIPRNGEKVVLFYRLE